LTKDPGEESKQVPAPVAMRSQN